MKKITRESKNLSFLVDGKIEPKISIKPGEILMVETERADLMYLNRENPVFLDHADVMKVGANPVTGPIYVEGAEKGDKLAVTVHDIVLGEDKTEAYCTYVPGQGVFGNAFYPGLDYPPCTQWFDVSGENLRFNFSGKEFALPVTPFIGTICVAPAERVALAYTFGKDILGNVDCGWIRKGSEIVMPVNQSGALLSVGDLHAAQGAGELLGCAIETRGYAVISVRLIKAEEEYCFDWPQVNTDKFIGSVGCIENSLEAAVRHAVYDLIKRVEWQCKISFMEAYMLLGECVEIDICQFTDSLRSALAKLDRKYLVKN